MPGSRGDIWKSRFGFVVGITLFEGIEEDDLIRGTMSSRNQGRGSDA